MSHDRENHGFSLIEMLITLSILALANMYAIELGTNQLKQSRNITFQTDLTSFQNLLLGILGDEAGCDVNFGLASGHPLWFDLSQIDSANGHSFEHRFPVLGIVQKKRVPASDPTQPAHWVGDYQILGISPTLNPNISGRVTPALKISNPMLTQFIGGPASPSETTTEYQAQFVFTADKNDAQGLMGRLAYGSKSLQREFHMTFLVDRATQTVISCRASGGGLSTNTLGFRATAAFCGPGMYQIGTDSKGAPLCSAWGLFQGPGAFGDEDRADCETCWGGRLNWVHTCPDETPWVLRFGQRKDAPGREIYLQCGGPNGLVKEYSWRIGAYGHNAHDGNLRDSEWGYSKPWDVGCDRAEHWMSGARQDENGEVHAICSPIDPTSGRSTQANYYSTQTSRMGRPLENQDHIHWGPRHAYDLTCPPNTVLAGFKQTEGGWAVAAFPICRGPKSEFVPGNSDDNVWP